MILFQDYIIIVGRRILNKFKNLFDMTDIPSNLSEEWLEDWGTFGNIRLERIVSKGHTSDWYDQSESELVVLIQGEAVLEREDGSIVELTVGDALWIPAGVKHRVQFTGTNPVCIWLCIFVSKEDSDEH